MVNRQTPSAEENLTRRKAAELLRNGPRGAIV